MCKQARREGRGNVLCEAPAKWPAVGDEAAQIQIKTKSINSEKGSLMAQSADPHLIQ